MANVDSLWKEKADIPSFPQLHSDIKTDVLIIGGGLAGILSAYMLRKAQVDCVLVEAGEICRGVTQNTTAKITVQHGLMYNKLIQTYGYERAQMYLYANQKALDVYRELCMQTACNFESKDNYVYSQNDRGALEQEFASLQKLGIFARMVDHTNMPLPVHTAGAVCVPNQAQFNPVEFVSGIASGLRIYENTPALELVPRLVRTPNGNIRAQKIIVATHFPILNKRGMYFMKLYQHRSYVLALGNAADVHGMYVDEASEGMSFRNYGDILLLGGGAHRTGKRGGGWRELADFASIHYPNAKTICRWATQDCMTLDGIPYIGKYSKNTPDLYVLTGFNKWGMTNAMAGAILLKDMILDKTPSWAEVFSPSRSMLHKQLFINAMESTLNLVTPTIPRCPHMGCALKYNSQEHSWDCPCHGSRFTNAGKLMDNPARRDIGSKK